MADGTPHPVYMNNEGFRTSLTVQSIGEAALDILSNSHHGSVLARVSGAIYLVNELGELFWLTPTSTMMHQRCLQAAAMPRMTGGSEYKITDHTLKTNTGDMVNFEGAQIWKTETIAPEHIISLSKSYAKLLMVVNQLLEANPPTGLGQLIPAIIANFQSTFLEVKQQGAMIDKAWSSVKDITQGLMTNDSERLIHSAMSLIGYGEGLTPAGDDFLGGLLFSVSLLHQYHPHVQPLPVCTYSDFIRQSKSLTNPISYTLLKDHANGHTVEPLHQLSNGLLLGEPLEHLYHYAEKLISIGHSTGWDMSAGFLAGMSIATLDY